MEKRHIGRMFAIERMNTAEVKELRLCNYDGAPTEIGLNTLDEIFEQLKGRC